MTEWRSLILQPQKTQNSFAPSPGGICSVPVEKTILNPHGTASPLDKSFLPWARSVSHLLRPLWAVQNLKVLRTGFLLRAGLWAKGLICFNYLICLVDEWHGHFHFTQGNVNRSYDYLRDAIPPSLPSLLPPFLLLSFQPLPPVYGGPNPMQPLPSGADRGVPSSHLV